MRFLEQLKNNTGMYFVVSFSIIVKMAFKSAPRERKFSLFFSIFLYELLVPVYCGIPDFDTSKLEMSSVIPAELS